MNQVAAVVVTYNRLAMLKQCIEHLKAQSCACDIIVINNASTDGTTDWLNTCLAGDISIHICNFEENTGGAGGFNAGMRLAAETGYEYVWVMDDDCMPKPNALEKLLEWNNKIDTDYGFLSSKVLWKNGQICSMNIQRKTLTKKVTDFSTECVPVVMASFVSLLVPVSKITEVGLPIKDFFIWTDDWEFTRRLSMRYPCYLINSSEVTHESAVNIGANIANDSTDRLDRYYYLYRNDVYLYRREGLKGFCYELARLSVHLFRILCEAKDNRKERIRIVVNGTITGLRFYPKIEYVKNKE